MRKKFDGQTVIISGGLGDIGFATALAFASGGAAIALGDRHPSPEAELFLKKIKKFGVDCSYTQVDVADAAAVSRWVHETGDTMGMPCIIIANAAVVTSTNICDMTPDQWKQELDVNLNGSFYLTQSAANLLIERQLPGRIVFVSSWAAVRVHKHIPAYCVSKAGLDMLCKCMALGLAANNILVNAIAPGYVDAGLSGRLWRENPGSREKARQRVPVKRLIKVEEIAEQIIYLCSPENNHMTGSTLLIDGGLSLL